MSLFVVIQCWTLEGERCRFPQTGEMGWDGFMTFEEKDNKDEKLRWEVLIDRPFYLWGKMGLKDQIIELNWLSFPSIPAELLWWKVAAFHVITGKTAKVLILTNFIGVPPVTDFWKQNWGQVSFAIPTFGQNFPKDELPCNWREMW